MATQQKGAPAAKSAPKEAVRTVSCTATRMGYYGMKRVREGQPVKITLRGEQQLPSWVKPAEAKAAPAAPKDEQEQETGTGEDGGTAGTDEPVI